MRFTAAIWICTLIFLVQVRKLSAQASVEYAGAAAASAGAAAPAKGLSKGISGAFGSLEKALKSPTPPAEAKATPAAPAKRAPVTAPKSVTAPKNMEVKPVVTPVYEDLKKAEVGLSYQELVKRFGPPAMEIASSGRRSLTYLGKDGATQIEMQGDKVVSITPAGSL